MDYTFQDEDDSARRRTWIGATAFALAIVIGAILLLRAGSRGTDEGEDKGNPDAPQKEAVAPPSPPAPPPAVPGSKGRAPSVPQKEAAAQPAPPAPPVPVPESRGRSPSAPQDEAASLPPPAPKPKSKPAPAKPAGANARALLAQGQDAERANDLTAARAAYEAALASDDLGEAQALVESRLGAVMVNLVTSQQAMPEKIDYTIAKGDALEKIARRHDTTTALVAASNGIADPKKIQPGKKIRLLDNAKFEIFVSTTENWLLLKMNGKFFKRYTVGTGRDNGTPLGTYTITDKIEKPNWWKDNVEIPFGDERNILGTRWMAITATGSTPPASGYGIHGTWDNSSLGQQSSAGCVRMANGDVEELFMIVPKGTPVIIED